MKRNSRLAGTRLKAFRAVAWAVALYAAYVVLTAPYEPGWTPVGILAATGLGLTLKRTARKPRRPRRRNA